MHSERGDHPDTGRTVEPADGIRLNRYIASCGICSRREADKLIEQGLVTVNGEQALEGMKTDPEKDVVRVRGQILQSAEHKTVVAYYKPVGVTCTEKDPHAARTLSDVFKYPVRLTYAGRLDRDSEGLLLMTNDGMLIDAMMRGANGHEKEYIVRVNRHVSDAEINHLRKGVYLKELDVTTRPCRIERLGEHTFDIVLTQGLNNQIRRMFRTVDAQVKRLKRIRVLTIRLDDMKPNQLREITGSEKAGLYQAALARERG
ncbi:MAG: rRNA pseudouridine synthase [Lachnospiraceae bacterium]|nr:rRNA pseudouridine synthase [Lachnospiraceae bacterium]